MLTTEEVDIDYFTPTTSSTLSTIFVNSKEEDTEEKKSLKYNPPPPPVTIKPEKQLTQGQTKSEKPNQNQIDIKPEESEQAAFIFADIVYAYEWINNAYVCRGSLGFAIYNSIKYSIHKLIIYDSKRITLSSLTIGKNTEIKVNYDTNTNIAYYDDAQKFWIVNPPAHKLQELLNILTNIQVNLTFVSAENSVNNDLDKVITTTTTMVNKKDSDTDAALNRIKDSLLIKLSNIGLPVLPQIQAVPTQKTNINNPQINNTGTKQTNEQIVPVRTKMSKPKVTITAEETQMGLFLSEQRVSNSELRINMNRMSDKLDLLINKVKDVEIVDKSNSSQLQNEIVIKLLHEYEKKIQKYEDFIKLAESDRDMVKHSAQHKGNEILQDTEVTAQKCYQLEQLCKEKDNEITRLKQELHSLNNKAEQLQFSESRFLKKICDKKDNLIIKNKYAENVIQDLEDSENNETQINDSRSKLKKIMNDTFQTISDKFVDEEKYTGSKIKNIVGLILKKTTMDSLKEFQ